MARWVEFIADHDHRWRSRAVTAFKAGMISFVKEEVARAACRAGRARPAEPPADAEADHGA